MISRDVMRIVQIDPYTTGQAVRVALIDSGKVRQGRTVTHVYAYQRSDYGQPWIEVPGPDGAPYSYCSVNVSTSIDGDDATALAISCVAIQPGDTDPEYFEHYTPEMLALCEEMGEALSLDWEERRDWPEDCATGYTSDGDPLWSLPWSEVDGDDPTSTEARVWQRLLTAEEIGK